MFRFTLIVAALIALASLTQAAPTVVVNGKVVTVSAIEQNGKAFLDVVALMKLLGGKATYDADSHKVTVNSASSGGGGSAGTSELAGDNGELGKVYSIRKGTPLFFSLKSAEYSVQQFAIGDRLYYTKADTKFLMLHFTIQNPAKTETFVRGDSLKFTAVDAKSVNFSDPQQWGDAGNHSDVSLTLKPAQTIALYTAIEVPANGEIPKLMVQSPDDNDGPVLRYDLRGQLAGLSAPYADPADAAGMTLVSPVPAQLGVSYPCQALDVTVEKPEYVTTALGEDELEAGERFLVVPMKLRNESPDETFVRFDTLTPTLTDTDGGEVNYRGMLLGSANRPFQQTVKGGQEVAVRLYFQVGKDVTPKTLVLKEGEESRSYQYELK